MFSWGKRGTVQEDQYKQMLNVLFWIAVIVLFGILGKSYIINDNSFFTTYYSRDVALLSDIFEDVPGEGWVVYSIEDSSMEGKVDFTFSRGWIEVFETDDTLKNAFPFGVKEEFSYFGPSDVTLREVTNFKIKKNEDNLTVEAVS